MHDGENMSDRVRDPGHGLIIGMSTEENVSANRQTVQTYKAYFFKVTKSAPFYYFWDELGALNSGQSSDYTYLGDSGHGVGEDVLRVEEDDFIAYQFGYAPEDPNLRVYEAVSPAGTPNRALDRQGEPTYPDPTTPATSDYFMSRFTEDKYDPPASTERVSFRNDDDGQFLQFGFYADADVDAANAALHLVGRGYQLVPVTDTGTQDQMLSLVTGEQNATEADAPPTVMTTVGGLPTFKLGTERPDEWDDNHAQVLDYGVGRV